MGWRALRSSVLCKVHNAAKIDKSNTKIAAFDFDGCLWTKKLSKNGLLFTATTAKISALDNDGYRIAILSNESLQHFKPNSKAFAEAVKRKLQNIDNFLAACGKDVAFEILVATNRDRFRKLSSKDLKKHGENSGGIGMWELLEKDVFKLGYGVCDKDASFYVGDAAGRRGDHSDGDKKFAEMVGVKFCTPEEVFMS